MSARAQDRILREQYLTKVERKCKVGDAKGVTHTSPGQRELGRAQRLDSETPGASLIPAQGNALGSSAQNPISAESAIHTRNPWFQLLFLGLIPRKSQASTNSVLRPCPRSEKDAQ